MSKRQVCGSAFGAKAKILAALFFFCSWPRIVAGEGSLTIEDLLAQETLHRRSPLAATADGRALAVTVVGAHEEPGEREQLLTRQGVSPENAGAAVVLIDLETGRRTRPFEGESPTDHTSFSPVFSPDGQRLAAYVRSGPRHLCPAIYHLETGALSLYDHAPAQSVTAWSVPEWLPDGSGLIFPMPPADPEAESGRLAISVERHGLPPAASDRPGAASWTPRLALLTHATGNVRLLYAGFVSTWRVSPDGRSVAANVMREPGIGERVPLSELVLIDLETDETVELGAIPRTTWGPALSFSPDGEWLGWAAEGAAGMVRLAGRRSFSVPGKWRDAPPGWTPDGAMLLLAEDGLHRVRRPADDAGENAEAERWVDLGSNPGWATANRGGPPPEAEDGMLWVVREDGADHIDLANGTVAEHFAARLGGKRFATAHAIFSQRGDRVDRLDLRTGEQQDVYVARAMRRHRPATRRTLEWSLPGGQTARGHLFLPPGHVDEPIPIVVDVYAGTGLRSSTFIDHRLLTAAGYGVFLPQIPVGVRTDLMREIRIGVDAAVDALLESGLADPERLAIQGQSFGVFAVFSVLAGESGGRFRTAVACNGTMDLLQAHQLGAHWWVERGQGGMGATPWENRERYLANAPYWHLERVACPVLLIQGEADASGPMMHMAYQSLKRLEKPVELRVYEGGGHVPTGWPASQQRDVVARLLEWYGDHLRSP